MSCDYDWSGWGFGCGSNDIGMTYANNYGWFRRWVLLLLFEPSANDHFTREDCLTISCRILSIGISVRHIGICPLTRN